MTKGHKAPLAAVVFALSLLVAGCLGGTTPVPKVAVTALTDVEVNAQPNWTVGWAMEVFESIGDNLTAELAPTVPAGWGQTLLRTTLNFSKANDRRVTFLLVDIPVDQANGTYDVSLKATVGAESAQANLKVHVSRPNSNLLHNGTVVKMDYVGFLADNNVFDTSVWNVANSTGLDKWPDFKNGSATRTMADYNPLELTLGKRQVIPGWEEGLQNMSLAQGKALIIPPELAYGQFFDQPVNLTQTVEIYNTTNVTAFRVYTGSEAQEHAQYIDPVYGWTIEVVNVDNTTGSVTFRNMPVSGAPYTPYKVNATVTNLSTALGTFEVHFAPALDQTTAHQGNSGVVTTVNETAFNIHWQTNQRQSLAPHTLYFLVFVRTAQG